ncbi:hypothetical protein [Micromonospora sp. NPDC023814]|uniref:hypothetical protein n=1 Tax=Micromonospora sp. NPDC023814 TaxID=3154596 RepID=UPI0033D91831
MPADQISRTRRLNDLPIRVILDASAILAFAEESIDVGEVIAEVADEGCMFGLPVACLAEAFRLADADRLDMVVNHPAAAVLTVDPLNWRACAMTHLMLGRFDAASALLAAVDNECHLLTGQPGLYAALADGGPIIPLQVRRRPTGWQHGSPDWSECQVPFLEES